MFRELATQLAGWQSLDTWIVIVGALAAMACAVPGVFLVLRRQSLMGDALSHTALLGIVLAYMAAEALLRAGWITGSPTEPPPHWLIFLFAIVVGVLTAVITEFIQKLGRVESSAALGVVFTTLFAVALLLIRAAVDSKHLDPDCVLYGTIETAANPSGGVPRAAVVNAAMLAFNLLLTLVFFKELRISTFDPALATTLGINASAVNYVLMAVTAATLTAAFESVGSILVIAMLIVPAATATLLSQKLPGVIGFSLLVAALGAALGHAAAITLPAMIFPRLGFADVSDASTAGMMAFATGVLFLAAILFAPRQGLLVSVIHRFRLGIRIAGEDVLGYLFRLQESAGSPVNRTRAQLAESLPAAGSTRLTAALRWLRRQGLIAAQGPAYLLTESGTAAARSIVRGHRLWESYVARHFPLPEDHLHATAERVEHYLDPTLRDEIAEELRQPSRDPHGKTIPEEIATTSETAVKQQPPM